MLPQTTAMISHRLCTQRPLGICKGKPSPPTHRLQPPGLPGVCVNLQVLVPKARQLLNSHSRGWLTSITDNHHARAAPVHLLLQYAKPAVPRGAGGMEPCHAPLGLACVKHGRSSERVMSEVYICKLHVCM